MRGKAGRFSRLIVPPPFVVESLSAFASASGEGTEGAPVSVLLSGNSSPEAERQVTVRATVSGTLKFDLDTFGFAIGGLFRNETLLLSFSGGVNDSFYLPISITTGDLVQVADYDAPTADNITASLWISVS
jgi:hypothetical protein